MTLDLTWQGVAMDVREYVSKSLTQIMEAIAECQTRAGELGGYVNPVLLTKAPTDTSIVGMTPESNPVINVEFDIATTVGAEHSGEAGAKIQVASLFSAGGKGGAKDRSEATSRIRFVVPVMLPVAPGSVEAREQRSERLRKAALPQRRQVTRSDYLDR